MNASLSIGSGRIGEIQARNKWPRCGLAQLTAGPGDGRQLSQRATPRPIGRSRDRNGRISRQGLSRMRDTRLYTTAFAAAFASLLGLGPGAAANLSTPPQSYESERTGGETLPIWLVRYKLRKRGYQDIYRVSAEGDGFAVCAHDC